MAAVRFRPGLQEQIGSLTDLPVLAVDLGFSKRRRSCGVAWRDDAGCAQSGSFPFGGCVEKVAGLLREHPEAVLIVEAPLSGLFAGDGNPVERGGFEREGGVTRYWYNGPGAATCLAAAFFLRALPAAIHRGEPGARPTEVVLYEGFVTFKRKATDHAADARLLLECFLGTGGRACEVIRVEAGEGQRIVAVADVVAGSDSGSGAPAIVVPVRIPPDGPRG